MKAGFIGAALGLAAVAAAQPHHHARHEQFHRRDVQTETVTNTVTDTLEEVVVYMDESGKPVSTSTFYKKMTPSTQAAPAPAATSAPSSSSAVAANFLAATHAAESSSSAAPAPAASSSSSSSASSSSSSSGSLSGSHSGSKGGIGFGSGVSYSPYHDSGACKDVSAIKQDLAKLDMDVIRLYGTDCKQVENTLDALKEMGKNSQLFVGIFDIGSWSSEADTIISAVKNHAGGDWSKINAVNVGNEIVNAGGSVSQVTSAVSSTRSKLQSAGYNGPVVTVDTMVAHRDHPELAEASDFVAMNCHAFFDGNVAASGAGEFVQGWVKQIGDAHPGKKVIVTESGWPSQGDTNQKCVPSEANQSAAVGSLKSSFSENLILFSAYNNKWKTSSAAQFNAEQWWGIMGNSPSSN